MDSGPQSHRQDTSPSSWTSEASAVSWNTFKTQLQMQIMQLQRMVAELKNSTARDRMMHDELHKDLATSKGKIKAAESSLTNLQRYVASQTDDGTKLKKQTTDWQHEVNNIVAALQLEIEQLKVDTQTMTRSVQEIQTSGGGATSSALPGNITQLFQALERQLGMYDAKIAEMGVRFEVVESTSHDGKLIWKIPDFSRRKEDARKGKTLSIYSQPFYTSRFGYKMCLRLYPNGDGMGKNTHISLFFVLMKGGYDSLLPFPFRQKVTLMLLDQSPERRHLTDVFRPDPSSSSFRRPVTDMNIASGCPMFVGHDTLVNSSYLKEEAIFIKCVVDTSDLENY